MESRGEFEGPMVLIHLALPVLQVCQHSVELCAIPQSSRRPAMTSDIVVTASTGRAEVTGLEWKMPSVHAYGRKDISQATLLS